MAAHLSFADYIERAARLSVPYSFMAILFVLSIVSVPYPLAAFFKAPLLLIAIYYWGVFRPTLLPPLLVFVAGLLYDVLTGMPYLGLSAILFLLCRMAIVDQRRFLVGQGFAMLWFGFCIVDVAYHLLQWGIFSALNAQWLYAKDFVSSLVLGFVLFPVVYLFLFLTHKFLPAPSSVTQNRLGANL